MNENKITDTFAFSALVGARDVTIRIDCEPERGAQRASDPCRVVAKCKMGDVPYGCGESLSVRDPRTIGQAIDGMLSKLMALCDRDGKPQTEEEAYLDLARAAKRLREAQERAEAKRVMEMARRSTI